MAKKQKQAAEQELQVERLVRVPVDSIAPSGNNCRVIDEKSASFAELMASVKAAGVVVPVHVRQVEDAKGGWELLAGERRWRAAKAVGDLAIPAIDHGVISDEEAFEITFTENYQRQDLTPLEQGKAVALLREKYHGDDAAVASKLGRSVSWVRQRAMIEENLSSAWRAELAKADSWSCDWTVGHLVQIARLPAATQEAFLQGIIKDDYMYDPECDITGLTDEIDRFLGRVKGFPWSMDDATLVAEAGSCRDCAKRTGAQPGLFFEDDADEKTITKNEQCLDPECRARKLAAYVARQSAQWRAKAPQLKMVYNGGINYHDQKKLEKQYPGLEYENNFQSCKKNDPAAIPALVVHGKGVGKVRWVKPWRSESARAGGGHVAGPKPLKERRAQLEARRWARVIEIMRAKVGAAEVGQIVWPGELRLNVVLTLAAEVGWGLGARRELLRASLWAEVKRAQEVVGPEAEDLLIDLEARLWEGVKEQLVGRLHDYRGTKQGAESWVVKEAGHQAELLGIDIAGIYAEVCETKGFTVPKSWASLKADGTATAAKKGKKKAAKGPRSKRVPRKRKQKAAKRNDE